MTISIKGREDLGYLGSRGDGKLILTKDPKLIFRWALQGMDKFEDNEARTLDTFKTSPTIKRVRAAGNNEQ